MAERSNKTNIKVNTQPNASVRVIAESNRKKTKIGRLLTLELISSMIRKLDLDEYTTNGLIALASRYPAAALPSFKRNINLMIQRVRIQRQKDQQGEGNYGERKERFVEPVFDTGPQKISITAADLGDEWDTVEEGEGIREVVEEAQSEETTEVIEEVKSEGEETTEVVEGE